MTLKSFFSRGIDKMAFHIVSIASRTLTILLVFLFIVGWGIAGFYFHFSAGWELIMGTTSSVVTILMVFLILKAQNKDSLSIQLKLNELVASNESASNRLVDVEGMTEEELKVIRKYYSKLSDFAGKQNTLQESHSIEEIHQDHAIRNEMEKELNEMNKPDEV